jgi:isopenicillin N synthase-like dioxygenase
MDGEMQSGESSSLPILDLSHADNSSKRPALLDELHNALFNVGFLYIKDHGVSMETIMNLVSRLPALFNQGNSAKARLSKLNSPHFLGYSGFAEEMTLGEKDLREQFDLATELPVI